MRIVILLICCILSVKKSRGQEKLETHSRTIITSHDSFGLRWPNAATIDRYKFGGDTANFNNGAAAGDFFVLYFNTDSILFPYKNKIPYGHYKYFNFITGSKKKTIRLGFDPRYAVFSNGYMAENIDKVHFDIPEVYELANIIWTLSPSGEKAKDLNKEGSYYTEIVSYFKPYLSHPIFQQLRFQEDPPTDQYYDFRENSYAFRFKQPQAGSRNTELLYNGPYYKIYGNGLADSSLFGKLKPLIEDFAKKSKFRQFYKDHLPYYKRQLQREKELLPVKQMWTWLEQQFPDTKYQSYHIIFSPLISGSHSTQNFTDYSGKKPFSQSVMFICNTDRVDQYKDISEKQKEGLMSGIVFTEIDHNYVNRASAKYGKEIDSLFSNRSLWVSKSSHSDFYGSPRSIFNEYMTWSIFCLYVLDHYNKEDADFVINERVNRMVEKRNFIQFKEFNLALINIKKEHPQLKVVELYPYILRWCKQQR